MISPSQVPWGQQAFGSTWVKQKNVEAYDQVSSFYRVKNYQKSSLIGAEWPPFMKAAAHRNHEKYAMR
jgi:hypothetical protein